MAADRSRTGAVAVAAVVLTVAALAGCGSSKSSSSSTAAASASSTTAPPATTSSTTTSSTSTTTSSSTTTTTSAPSSSKSASVLTAPPPAPSGTPAAPAGLSQTTGYSTYELCSLHCTGSVPASLRRPLHLSGASCGSHSGGGPVTPTVSGALPVTSFIGSQWKAGRVIWTAPPTFSGPILIRGRATHGSAAVGFGEGRTPYDELQLLAIPGRHQWPSFTRVRAPGCYAYQVDTAAGSEVIAFSAR